MPATLDPSTGLILAEDSPYLANLSALWAADPLLAAQIDALGDDEIYPTEPSRAGPPTILRVRGDGSVVYFHSRHNPIDEAVRLIDTLPVDQKVAFYLLGLGLGYHLDRLFDRASDEAIFCLFEPDLKMIRTALTLRDLSAPISSGRLMFFWRLDKPGLFRRLTPQSTLISMGFQAVVHAPSLQFDGEFYQQAQIWLAEFASFCRTNINTLVLNSCRTAENISRNIGRYVASAGIGRLKDRHRKTPAIIVSAGPSLRKNMRLLKGAADHAVLIAVQTTLQPLLDMGVQPHYGASLDYHDISTRFFQKLPKSISTELIAEPKAAPAIFSLYPGPVTVMGNEFAQSLLREMKIDRPALTSGATVAHLAFYLAEYMGCDPIIFVGQDLGFSDGLCYTPGTSYEDVWRPELGRFCSLEMKQWDQIVRDRYILRKIPDCHGRPMYTEERLFTYLQQFERDFAASKSKIVDATEGGALKRGSETMSLAAALERYCGNLLPSLPNNFAPPDWSLLAPAADCLEKRRGESVEIQNISRLTLPLLEEIRDHLDDQARVNHNIARIDRLRHQMDQHGATYDLVCQLTQQTELRRFEQDRKIAASKLDGLARQRRQVERDLQNVAAIIDAAQQFQELMSQVIGNLNEQSEQLRLTNREAA